MKKEPGFYMMELGAGKRVTISLTSSKGADHLADEDFVRFDWLATKMEAAEEMLELLKRLVEIAPNEGSSPLAVLGLEAQALIGKTENDGKKIT